MRVLPPLPIRDSSEHRAPRDTQLHQIREVPAAQQLLIWENDFSELYTRALDSEMSYNHDLLQKGLRSRVWASYSEGWGRAHRRLLRWA